MEENKYIIDYPCKTCAHALVCTHRGRMALLTNYLENPVKEYIDRGDFPNGLASVKVTCSFYSPAYTSQILCGSPWLNKSDCC